jgi:hypothetical protein
LPTPSPRLRPRLDRDPREAAEWPGDVIIEHEDRDFEGTDELVKRGFLVARDILRPYVK